MRWTYDPLIRRNARLNLVRLGAEVVAFLPDFYGELARRDHRRRPQRPLRGALASRLAAHRAGARRSARCPSGTPRADSPSSPTSRRVRAEDPEVAARLRDASREAFAVLVADTGPPRRARRRTATTSSLATTPTGRPDERHERHERPSDTTGSPRDRAHRAAPPRGAAGAAVRDLLRTRDGARGAPRARRHRLGRRLGRVRRRSRPVLLGRVRRRRGIRDRALPRAGAARPARTPCRAAPFRLRMPRARRRPRDRVRAGRPCRSRHPWRRPSRSSPAIAWRRPPSRPPCSTRSCGRRAARWASCSARPASGSTAASRSASRRPSNELLDEVMGYVEEGYRRIKLKIKPGWDLVPVGAVREELGHGGLLQVDANTAYTADDIPLLAELDAFDLLLIEQPFAEEDLATHVRLAEACRTPVCLDESILGVTTAVDAIDRGATSVVNIKPGRMGGYLEALRVHDACRRARRPGLVRRHARDRGRTRRERRARGAAGLHAARRHLGVGALLRRGRHRAVRARRRRAPRAAPGAGCRGHGRDRARGARARLGGHRAGGHRRADARQREPAAPGPARRSRRRTPRAAGRRRARTTSTTGRTTRRASRAKRAGSRPVAATTTPNCRSSLPGSSACSCDGLHSRLQ